MSRYDFSSGQFLALKQVIKHLVSPPEEELLKFLELVDARTVKQGDYFLRVGDQSSEFAFINAGLFRFFYQTSDGKEFNKSFSPENAFIGAYSAFLTQHPSRFSIQALEDSHILAFQIKSIIDLFDQHSCWERLGRLLAEQLYVKKETREAQFLLDNAEKRYHAFQETYPGLEERIPQYHVASYLGITPVALSRIRRR